MRMITELISTELTRVIETDQQKKVYTYKTQSTLPDTRSSTLQNEDRDKKAGDRRSRNENLTKKSRPVTTRKDCPRLIRDMLLPKGPRNYVENFVKLDPALEY